MQAVEFETVVNGKTILIPEKCPDLESQNVKVIILIDSKTGKLKRRKPGTAKGKIFLADDVEAPLNKKIIEQFYQ
ncbi:MAG: hypothetical protein KAW12_27045 [Candidatus Aminicenantes bacterium]|nr:hypothetical protein [Candidatus Aminicenantes bacterium]